MVAAHQVTPFTHLQFKKIAVLTDLSGRGENGLRYAAALARIYEAEIVLAHTYIPLPCAFSAPTPALVFETLHAERRGLESNLRKEAGASFLQDLKCSILLMQGAPQDLFRKMKDIDLIVVGTSGHTGMAKAAFGSVAETIFRSSPVPVLTVGPRCGSIDRKEAGFKTVLYATDFSSEARLALPCALSIAQKNEAQLILMHVAAGNDNACVVDNYAASAEPLEALHALMQPGLRLKVPPMYLVEFGNPDTDIPEAARTLQASVIVMGTHGAGKFTSILSHLPGRTAYHVAAHAGCPVLTVRIPEVRVPTRPRLQ